MEHTVTKSKKIGSKFILYNDNQEPIYNFSKRDLSDEATKETIETKTGADLGTIDKTFAKLLEIAEKKQDQDTEDGGRESQADALVKLALSNAEELFHDNRQMPYIRLRNSDVLTTPLRLRSREVKTWMAGLLWNAHEKAPNQGSRGQRTSFTQSSGTWRERFNMD